MTITRTLYVAAGKTLTLGATSARFDFTLASGTGILAGTITNSGSGRTVMNSGDLAITATGVITGTCNFSLSSGATLRIASTGGISSSGSSGNIQVSGSRTFSTGATYVYNGSSAQVAGTGLPATVANLSIENAAGVTLNSGVTATDLFYIAPGCVANLVTAVHFASTLTLGAYGSASGSFGSSASSATNKNNTYFAVTSGFINVTSSSCVAPTITLSGTNAAVCRGVISASLGYSASTGAPDVFSIDYDVTANAAGFVDAPYATLPSTMVPIAVPATAPAATYNGTLLLKNSITGCISNAYALTVEVQALSTSPSGASANPSLICAGGNSILSVTGGSLGAGATWHWYRDSCSGTPEGTGATITVNPVSTTTYTVRAEGNCNSTTCANVTVVVIDPPVGGAATATPSILCSGTSASIALWGHTGSIAKWQFSVDSTSWTDITSTDNPFTTGALTSTTFFRAALQSSPCALAYSTVAKVTVEAASIGGTANATPSRVCEGSASNISLTGMTGLIVKWQESPNGAYWIDRASTDNPFLSGPISSSTYFRALVQSGACTPAFSSNAYVQVDPVAVGGTTTAMSSAVCAGAGTGITLSGHTGSIVHWQISPDGVTWSNVASVDNPFPTGAMDADRQFRAVVVSGVCDTAYSSSVMVAVRPHPTAVLSGSQRIYRFRNATLSLAVTGSGTISGTLSDATVFSGTAPVITVQVSPDTGTTYTIASLSDDFCEGSGADLSGSAVVEVDSLAATSARRHAGWNMFSMPLTLLNMSPSGAFAGDSGASTVVWQVLPNYGYTSPPTLEMGRGYWTYQNDTITVHAIGAPVDSARLRLYAGWNLVGYPFSTPGYWATCAAFDSAGTVFRTFPDAASSNWIVNSVYSYNGIAYVASDDTVRVWTGYWMYVMKDSLSLTWRNRGFAKAPVYNRFEGWELPLAATLDCADGTRGADAAVLGVYKGASEGFDPSHDAPQPPSPPGARALTLAFEHGNGMALTRDIRGDEEAVWNAVLRSSQPGTLLLEWPVADADAELCLLDESAGARVDMHASRNYLVTLQVGEHRLRIVAGKALGTAQKLPSAFALEQNHPNPFRNTTAIRFSLPVESRATLRVHDVYGREVATLADGQFPAGTQLVRFESAHLPSGTYCCRLETEGRVLTMKMLLVK